MTRLRDANYEVFHRTWWKKNPSWPNGLEPEMGEKFHIAYTLTLQKARELCKEWNEENDPGELDDMAEFWSI